MIILTTLYVLVVGLVVGILVSSLFPISDGKIEEYAEPDVYFCEETDSFKKAEE
jgi:hypothetical protein